MSFWGSNKSQAVGGYFEIYELRRFSSSLIFTEQIREHV